MSQGNKNLIPFNVEIKATARQQGEKVRRKKKLTVVMVEPDNRVLRDYTLPQV